PPERVRDNPAFSGHLSAAFPARGFVEPPDQRLAIRKAQLASSLGEMPADRHLGDGKRAGDLLRSESGVQPLESIELTGRERDAVPAKYGGQPPPARTLAQLAH